MRIGETLIHQKSITNEQLDVALWVQRRWGGLLGRILCSRGYITEADLTAALSSQLGYPAVVLANRNIPLGLAHLLPVDLCVSHLFLPFGQDPDSGVIQVAMMDPRDAVAIAALRSCMTQPFRLYLCGYLDLTEALYRAAHAPESQQLPVRRATREIIQADSLVEEMFVPEAVMRPVVTARMELSAGYEVLEESEMLGAMAAQARSARRSAEFDLVVDSGEFEIVSAEDAPAMPGEASKLPQAEPAGEAAASVEAAPAEPVIPGDEKSPGKDLDEKPDTPAEEQFFGKTREPVARSGEPAGAANPPETGKKPPESGAVRKGLMAALGGSPREPEKKPPPSPFSPRNKK